MSPTATPRFPDDHAHASREPRHGVPEAEAPATDPTPPTPGDLAWLAAIGGIKALIVALAVDAFANSHSPRYSGKGMRLRAVGYAGTLLIVPVAWRLRGMREPYPRALDLAVALPILADAGGNAIGIYQRAHVDDAIHFANGALFTSVVGAVVAPRVRTPWEAAGVATAVGTAAAAAWEVAEWLGYKLGARGMHLTYDDTMADIIETGAGALLGGLVTLLRHPARLRRVPGSADDPLLAHRPHPRP